MAMPNTDIVKRILPNLSEVSEIKIGGQKAVFSAIDSDIGNVIVKIMLPGGSCDRLNREIEIVSSNSFPNVPIIHSYDTFMIDGNQCVYIVEQYIDGSDLRSVLNARGRLDADNTVLLMHSLLETAVALEKCRVVHRDIKPENILCSRDGKFWLLDFGIARDLCKVSLTDTAAHFGPHTAGYAAPEQFRNMKKKIDARADLFSIGVMAYEALSGHHPFATGARDYLDILRRTEAINISPLLIENDHGGYLAKFINLLMEKYPSRRPPSVKVAKDWFEQITRKRE